MMLRMPNRMLQLAIAIKREFFQIADSMKANLIFIEFRQFADDGLNQQVHQSINLFLRAIPVFGREGVQGKELYSTPGSGLQGSAHGFNTVGVAKDSLFALALCPTTIAIHDDGYMTWNTC